MSRGIAIIQKFLTIFSISLQNNLTYKRFIFHVFKLFGYDFSFNLFNINLQENMNFQINNICQ